MGRLLCCTPFGSATQECKNYLLLHSSFTFVLACSVFPIQSLNVCSKTRLIRNTARETLRGASATGAVRALSVTQASAYYFSRRVAHVACKKLYFARDKIIFNAVVFLTCVPNIRKTHWSLHKIYKRLKWHMYGTIFPTFAKCRSHACDFTIGFKFILTKIRRHCLIRF